MNATRTALTAALTAAGLLLTGCATSTGSFTVASGAGLAAGATPPGTTNPSQGPLPVYPQNPDCPYTPSQGILSSWQPNGSAGTQTGHGLTITGTITSDTDCTPLAGATVEIWHEDPHTGGYKPAYRTTLTTDARGQFHYETDPLTASDEGENEPHLHYKVTAPSLEMPWWGTIDTNTGTTPWATRPGDPPPAGGPISSLVSGKRDKTDREILLHVTVHPVAQPDPNV